MSVQNGKDLLLKVRDEAGARFETVAGLRATRIAFGAETVDATSIESGGWRELLASAGVRSATVSGSGVFRDEATDARMRRVFFEGAAPRCQVVIPDFGVVEGAFQITSLEYAGTHDGEATYEVSLASAGALGFSAL